MSNARDLERMVCGLPAPVQTAVAGILSQVAHDLSTPVATVTMEVYSARRVLGTLAAAAAAASDPGRDQALTELADICANLEGVLPTLADYIATLSSFAKVTP